MINNNSYEDVSHALVGALTNLLKLGYKINVRGSETTELQSVLFCIRNPNDRLYLLNERNDNPFAKIAETLWMLAGRDDIEWLSYYLPRAVEFSDNGRTWRGAYGPRLRNWSGVNHTVDQLANVVKLLNEKNDTRQAVISIWDPSEDICESRDVPCNNWIHFMIRDNFLNIKVVQRSSDIIWGFSGIDTYSWSLLQEMMAYWTNTNVGVMHYFISSLHLYDRHYEKAHKIIDKFSDDIPYGRYIHVPFDVPFNNLNDCLNVFFTAEHNIKNYVVRSDAGYCWNNMITYNSKFITMCLQMIFLYIFSIECERDELHKQMLAKFIYTMEDTDYKAAARQYFIKHSWLT